MNQKIKLREAVIVEGKYDKIRLASLLDALILDIGGFRIYKDKEKLSLVRALAKTRGLIILTDSDRAGFQLRGFLGGSIPKEQIIHVYIPDIHGKERRKARPGKEGKIGVEGMDTETLKHCLVRAGVLEVREKSENPVTRADLLEAGLIGGEESSRKRKQLQKALGLPENLSANMLREVLNTLYTRKEFLAALTRDRAE
ncbi:MAG: DUF4093 domain-containing protein [Oscillospiraceae bacterium]|jgi:ribonuclease M5|nr:DUF4093 domain-containing protein [Oscillospiraceae bacterium]